jgi:hypothetical protein
LIFGVGIFFLMRWAQECPRHVTPNVVVGSGGLTVVEAA